MQIERTHKDPHPDGVGPPTYIDTETHWWDGSQIYTGSEQDAGAGPVSEDRLLWTSLDAVSPDGSDTTVVLLPASVLVGWRAG